MIEENSYYKINGLWWYLSTIQQKNIFFIFSLYRNFYKCKNEKWVKIILNANGMPRNLVRMQFEAILCIESCYIDQEKNMKTLFSEFFNLFPTVPNLTVWEQVNFKFFGKFWIFGPISKMWDHKKIMLSGGSRKRCFFGVLH